MQKLIGKICTVWEKVWEYVSRLETFTKLDFIAVDLKYAVR